MDAITILRNAVIYPSAELDSSATCLIISGERIAAIGDNNLCLAWGERAQQSIDLDGRVVLPGITDAHIHLEKFAYALDQVDCETPTIEECLEGVRAAASNAPAGRWIRGHGWNQNSWGRFGTLGELDSVAPQNPVYLTAKSLHAAWVNSQALERSNLDVSSINEHAGQIGLNPDGSPNGILYEDAMKLVSEQIPRATSDETAAAIDAAQLRLLRYGITTVHDFDGPGCLSALQELRRRGALKIRVVKNIQREQLDAALQLGIQSGFGDDWLRIGHLKLFADGALGPQTAAMLDPYASQPENKGMLLLDRDEILAIGKRAVAAGLPLSIHAIGDRACREVIQALIELGSHGAAPLPHRIEHLQIVHPADLELLQDSGLTISMQPLHAPSDRPTAERLWGERCRWSYAWKAVQQTGSMMVFGSDSPVESPDPFQGIYAAVTRKLFTEETETPRWIEEECIDIQSALQAYIVNPPTAVGLGDRLGRLEPGYLADLIVLEHNPFTIPAQEIASLKVVGAMTGGEWQFDDF